MTLTNYPAEAGVNSPAPQKSPATAPTGRKSLGGLWRYVFVRFLLIIPTILILVTLVFFLMCATGDPVTAALGDRLNGAELQARIHDAGYDRPIFVQYLEYLGQIVTGDFGTSISDNRPITNILASFGTATLELVVYAMLVAFVVGIPLGLVAAYFRDKAPDAALRVFAILCYSTPVFFAGILLKLTFSVGLGVLPVAGRATTSSELALQALPTKTGIYLVDSIQLGDPEVIRDVLSHAVLPAVALGLITAGLFLRLVRTNVIGTLGMDYVSAARSRGVKEFRLVTRHAFKPALIPVVTVIGLQIAALLGGAVLTESTFEWKGLGFQLAQYLAARDFVAVQGIVALLAVIVSVTNFIVDIIAALIDPRVRY